jgi:predicted RNase H-like nuclease (RuvC/YqgF family)
MSREKLEQAKRNWEEKLAEYEYEFSITASAPQKFELRKKIEECDEEIKRINTKLESLKKDIEIYIDQPQIQAEIKSTQLSNSLITQKMNILHLSDLHFGTLNQAQLWSNQLAEDLRNELNISSLDAFILSGDVANKSTSYKSIFHWV